MSLADQVLRDIEVRAQKDFLPIVGPKKGAILAEEIRKAKPKRVLEVGTLVGYSAILMARELDVNSEIVTIELHPNEVQEAKENLRLAQIKTKIDFQVGDALKIISKLQGTFDFAFIDAEKSEYLEYLRLFEDKLVKGAVVVADNVGIFANQMQDYLNYVRELGKFHSKFVQVGDDGLEISVKL